MIEQLFVLDTIELPPEKRIGKIKEVTVAPIFAEAIEAIYADLPVSKLYE